eukprot:TRINITY_DN3657_c1_g3_i1.p1 TRINITY_DN3657_c1_g3~~TRINITY_DN3657_c1_g3_i1.p1  ORF type:complete len:1223 (+),score=281.98 TRINITY_DN3657_c1_g3_i1:62-3730(+)
MAQPMAPPHLPGVTDPPPLERQLSLASRFSVPLQSQMDVQSVAASSNQEQLPTLASPVTIPRSPVARSPVPRSPDPASPQGTGNSNFATGFTFGTPEENPALAKLKGVHTVPITLVIVLAMLMSSAASVGGGLFMYFESLRALEDTVREKSGGQMRALSENIKDICYSPLDEAEQYINFLYSDGVLTEDEASWAAMTRLLSWSHMRAKPDLYLLGAYLAPQPDKPEEASYFGMWRSPTLDGDSLLYAGQRYNNNPPVTTTAKGPKLGVPSYTVNARDGSLGTNYLTWDANRGYWNILGSYNESVDDSLTLDHGKGFEPMPYNTGVHRVLGRRLRGALEWASPDGAVYAYSGWDVMYAPPPAPHPWSRYRAVMVMALFVYGSWKQPVEEYSAMNPDTQVIVFDMTSKKVFATTEGEEMVDQKCFKDSGEPLVPSNCTLTVGTLKVNAEIMQDAHALLTAPGAPDFLKATIGDKECFMRLHHVYADVYLIWVRPTSTIQSKVQSAVTLVILFSLLVFLFDVCISALEVYYVAIPVRDVARAIESSAKMDLQAAENHLKNQVKKRVMVREVHTLLDGMLRNVIALREYKSFLPDACVGSDFQDSRYGDDSRRGSSLLAIEDVDAPKGDVAIVFSDIVQSTYLWENVPHDMAVALDLHNRLMRGNCEKHRGYEVKTIGDAFMIAFHTAEDAFNFGMDCQADLIVQPWPPGLLDHAVAGTVADDKKQIIFAGLRVRMGIHFGAVEVEQNPLTRRCDYRGGTVNKAARIEQCACHGMCAFSDEVKAAVESSAGLPMRKLGTRTLKGIGEVDLFYAVKKGMTGRIKHFEEQLVAPQAFLSKLFGEGSESSNRLVEKDDSAPNPLQPKERSAGPREGTRIAKQLKATSLERDIRHSHGAVAVMHFQHLQDGARKPLVRAANFYVQKAIEVSSMTRGTTEVVIGATIVVSWGLSSRVTTGDVQSLRFLAFMSKHVSGTATGVVVGPFFHGNVGTHLRRHHSIFGLGFQYATMLPGLCANYNTDALFVMQGNLPAHLAHTCQCVDVVAAEGDYAPFLVLERPIPSVCSLLKPTWDALQEDGEESPATKQREVVVAAACEGRRHESLGVGTDMQLLSKSSVTFLKRDDGNILGFSRSPALSMHSGGSLLRAESVSDTSSAPGTITSITSPHTFQPAGLGSARAAAILKDGSSTTTLGTSRTWAVQSVGVAAGDSDSLLGVGTTRAFSPPSSTL